jgi:hypothetical protein
MRNAYDMRSLLFQLEDSHIEYLESRLGFRFNIPELQPWQLDEYEEYEAIFTDSSGQFDAFVRRCIGTMSELEEHQNSGGTLLIGYPDGTYRELRIDSRHDGQVLPRITGGLARFGSRFRTRPSRKAGPVVEEIAESPSSTTRPRPPTTGRDRPRRRPEKPASEEGPASTERS